MKWFTHSDRYCCEFIEFAENTLESSAVTSILEWICEFGNDKDVKVTDYQTLDREGGNHEIVGVVIQGDREYGFRVRSGNWNGTEVMEFGEGEYFRLTDRSFGYE